MDPSTFLNTIYPGAIQTFRFSGILPSITASQAILESDWGRSSLAQECHNLFGIKADPGWKGEKKAYITNEYDKEGNLYTVTAFFRKYDSYTDSLKDHGKFFQENKRYADVIGLLDYREQARAILVAGYATDLHYAEKLIQLIEKNGLIQWDRDALTSSSDKKADFTIHVVREGDTVSEIAKKYDVSVAEIVAMNQLANPNLIYTNQKLTVATSGGKTEEHYYTVMEGDTLTNIAQRFGTSVQRIASDNKISDSNHIGVGQKIFISH